MPTYSISPFHDGWFTMGIVKRVTVSLPDETAEALRMKAEAEGKPLTAWLRDLLSREAQVDSNWAERFNELADKVATNVEWTWNREETYAERLR